MKINVNRRAFAAVIKTASSCVGNRAMLPILNNVLIEAMDGRVSATCTNLETRITAMCDADIENPGATTVPAKKLLAVLDTLPEDDAVVDSDENHHSVLSCGRSKIKFLGLPPCDFPKSEPMECENKITMDTAELRKMIDHTFYAVSKNDPRKTLQGMLFEAGGREIVTVGTDGKCLAVSKLNSLVEFDRDFGCIIPGFALAYLRSVKAERINLSFSPKIMYASAENFSFESKLIEGAYPNYRQVIPSDFQHSAKINAEMFLNILTAMSLISAESLLVKLTFSNGKLDFHAENASNGSSDSDMDIALEHMDTPLTVMMNPALISAGVKAGAEDVFEIKFNDGFSPVEFDFGNGSMSIVMPIRNK